MVIKIIMLFKFRLIKTPSTMIMINLINHFQVVIPLHYADR